MRKLPRMTTPHVTTGTIGWGDAGVRQTLEVMAGLVDHAVNEPAIVTFARHVAASAAIRDQYRQAVAIRSWLASVWRYVDDPNDRELLRDPAAMLQDYTNYSVIYGDCDEAAVMGAALGKAVGMSAELVALGFVTDPTARYQHVFAQLLTDDGQTVDLDVTKPRGPVPQVARMLTMDV